MRHDLDQRIALLLRKHRDLDYQCRHPGGRKFVSDWYCVHPFAREYLPAQAFEVSKDKELLDYCFQNDTHDVHAEIRQFHERYDGVTYSNDEIFVGSGTSGLIAAQLLMLASMNVKRLWYVRPLYYTFYYFARLFGFDLRPVCDTPLNKPGVKLNLPRKKVWLVICDPIWFMGRPIESSYIQEIAAWQSKTESQVLVDGAFQYMRWSGQQYESTSILEQDLTLRTICPTKTIAVHGVRFSYILLPQGHWENIRYAYANSLGASSVFDQLAALQIMRILNSPEQNSKLLAFISDRYRSYLERDIFRDDILADRTYFVFVRLTGDDNKYIVMDQDFFDTDNYPGYVRFNLLLRHDL